MQRHYIMKPHKEMLVGSLLAVSRGPGKIVVFISNSE